MIKQLTSGIAFELVKRNFLSKFKRPGHISHILLGVTYSCNSKCSFCSIWEKYQKKPQDKFNELSLTEIEKLAKDPRLALSELDFFGGEPFLRADLVAITKVFVENQKKIKKILIPTNGFLTGEIVNYVDEVKKFFHGQLSIGISIDGVGKMHDELRGIPGAYSKATKTLKELEKKTNVSVGVGMVATRTNYSQIWKLYSLFEKKFSFVLAHHDVVLNNRKKDFSLTKNQLQAINRQIGMIINDQEKKHFYWEKYLLNKMVAFYQKPRQIVPCAVSGNFLYIDPYGDVFPCTALNIKYGNIKNASLKTILAGKIVKNTRDSISAKKCACWAPCILYPSVCQYTPFYFWFAKEFTGWVVKKTFKRNQHEN